MYICTTPHGMVAFKKSRLISEKNIYIHHPSPPLLCPPACGWSPSAQPLTVRQGRAQCHGLPPGGHERCSHGCRGQHLLNGGSYYARANS